MKIRCICPPKANGDPRHESDTIELREKMDFRSSIAIRNALALESGQVGDDGQLDMADVLAILTERFVLYGIQSWTIVDAKGKPVDVSHQTIRELILTDIDVATDIGDEADARYREAVMLPLIRRGSTSSPDSPIAESTSAPKPQSTKPRTRSSRSSITSIPTADIATTSSSLAGGSSLSPKSESAA
jgi:hypothetical protein